MARTRVDCARPLLQGASGDNGDERSNGDEHGSEAHDVAVGCVGRARPGEDAQTD
jgi:hypothetical protein